MQKLSRLSSIRSFTASVVAAASLAACAHGTPPHAEVANLHAAISAVEAQKPNEAPQVDLHLQLARENMARAEKLMEAGKNDEARYVLLRAQSDAELALVMAKEVSAEQQAQSALDKVRALRTQVGE